MVRDKNGTDNLLAIADKYRGDGSGPSKNEDLSWRKNDVNQTPRARIG